MLITVIVPAYNAKSTLPRLLNSLLVQTCKDYEIIVVDDCSHDNTANIARSFSCSLIQLSENHGPAYCRNVGSKKAKGEILVFTDSDCRVEQNWLDNIHDHFINDNPDALMGRLIINPSNYIGDSISSLGFPAGGSVGFDNIWKVDENGFTHSLSSCNCAISKEIFWEVGAFDETFPYAGGEDSFLAYSLKKSGFKIKYCPDVVIYHEARDSLRDFLKWQFRRGISSFIFSTKVSDKIDFFSLRLWSTKNILKKNISDKKFPLIFFLLGTSLVVQMMGFLFAKYKMDRYENFDY